MKLNLSLSVLAAALTCTGVYAQTLDYRADVPFNFQVGDTAMPAGHYSVKNARGILTVAQTDGKKSVFRLTMPAARRTATPDGKLMFNRYGEDYYLTNVWTAGSREGQALVQSKHEKQLSIKFKTIETAGISLLPASR
ncbi:MAG: hypothetical protein JWP08_3793 [Bryobacterales bacterium]|jgi:hypothetical protein|nr:hypothetical protein [Bryobacterales bacterium]